MFGMIALGVVAVVAGILGLATTKPDTFVVSRETTMKAPPERIFPLLDDFREWRKWSPWEGIDPDLQRTYEGPERGVGAAYSWEGRKAGVGRMEIKVASPPTKLLIDLVFTKPFKASNVTEIDLTPGAEGTRVQWSMSGRNLFAGKVMSVFMDMDRLAGKDFEKGLAALKAIVESPTVTGSVAEGIVAR